MHGPLDRYIDIAVSVMGRLLGSALLARRKGRTVRGRPPNAPGFERQPCVTASGVSSIGSPVRDGLQAQGWVGHAMLLHTVLANSDDLSTFLPNCTPSSLKGCGENASTCSTLPRLLLNLTAESQECRTENACWEASFGSRHILRASKEMPTVTFDPNSLCHFMETRRSEACVAWEAETFLPLQLPGSAALQARKDNQQLDRQSM